MKIQISESPKDNNRATFMSLHRWGAVGGAFCASFLVLLILFMSFHSVKAQNLNSPASAIEENDPVEQFKADVVSSVQPKIVGSTNAIVEILPPASVAQGDLRSNTTIFAFEEKSIVITSEMTLDTCANSCSLITGTVVSSHFLHSDSIASSRTTLTGTITFDEKIIGVFQTTSSLNDTDALFGSPNTNYVANSGRGLEGDDGDDVQISPDRKTLTITFATADKPDQIRVITSSDIIYDWMVNNAEGTCDGTGDLEGSQGWHGGPINSRNGNLSFQERDLIIPVAGCQLEFFRSYASDTVDYYTSTMGYGWTHNYDMRLHLTETEIPDTVELQTSGGSRLPFYDNGDGTYTPYAGVTAELVEIGSTYVITGFNQKVYTFNAQGLLQEQADPYGNVITFTYNASDQLIEVGQGNRTLSYAYDGSDRLTSVTDNLNRQVLMAYDTNGDLVTVTDTLGLPTTYEYSGTTHLLTKVTDPSSTVVEETAYDNEGRAYQQWDGEGNLLVDIDYSLANTRVVTENGVVMTYTYDARNTLVGIEYACTNGTAGCQADSSITYDGNFKQDDVIDLNGNPTKLDWNEGGSNLEYVKDALDNETFLAYDQYNNLTQTVDARGITTTYYYDNPSFSTFLTRMTDALGNSTFFTPTTSADGIPGLLKQQEDPDGRITTYTYNNFGQITEMVVAAGTNDAINTTYGYDGVGRLITTTQSSASESYTSLNVYDDGDRLIAAIGNWTGSNPANWTADCDNSSGARDTNVCTLFDYDNAGRIISTTNTLGQTNLTFYDDAGRTFLSVTNWDGSSYNANNPLPDLCNFSNPDPEFNLCRQTEYDEYGRVFRTTDSIGRQSVTEYDSLGRVSRSVTNWQDGIFNANDPDGDIETLYEYDANGNVLVVTDTVGRMTRTFYDELNRVEGSISNWDGSTVLDDCSSLPTMRDDNICTQYEYDEVGNTIIVTDTLGRMSRTFYDDLNRVEATVLNWQPSLTSPDNCVLSPTNNALENICTLYGYDDTGNQITTTNALNQTSLTLYDSANRPFLTVRNWDGTPISSENDCSFPPAESDVNVCSVTYFDELGRRSGSKDALGNLTDFDYDGLGRIITTTRYLDNGSTPVETSIEYDALGNRLTQTDAEENNISFLYNELNRMETSTTDEGVTLTSYYNAAGWVTQTVDTLLHPTTFTYDDLGRRLTVTDAETNATEYVYDALGNQVAMIDAETVRTTYEYDDLNRLVKVIENDVPGSNPTHETDVVTEYEYDALGNRVHITNALGITNTHTTYDVLNRPWIVEDALGNQTVTLYNALGYRVMLTDGNEAVTTYGYDSLNRLETVNYLDDGIVVTYEYDALGNRKVMTDDLGTTSYDYDDLYRLVEVNDPFNATIGYSYDKVGNRTHLTYPDSRVVTYTYDMDNRLETVLDWDTGTTTYEYDLAGRLVTTILPNGVVSVNTYDDANRLIELHHTESSSGATIAQFEYILDKVGNRTIVTETLRQSDTAWLEEAKLTASDGAADDRLGNTVAVDGDIAVTGAHWDDDNGSNSGSAYIFVRDQNGNWIQQAKLTASDGAAGDEFGYFNVAISGETVIIGAWGDDDNGSDSGSAYIFVRDQNGNWIQQAKLTASDGAAGDRFGLSVAINEETVIVGAFQDDDNGSDSGSAYIFVRDQNDNWIQQAKLTASDGAADDWFSTVAINGNTAIVGALRDDDNGTDSGSAYIFVRDQNGNWTQQAKLTASDGAADDWFGTSVALGQETVIIGTLDYNNDNDPGSAYIFVRDQNGNWIQQAKLTASDDTAGDRFGGAVAISGGTAVVGAPGADDNGSDPGSAYVFVRDQSGSWTQQAKLTASDGAADDVFGFSVAISGENILVGASRDDDNGSESGSAYIFEMPIQMTAFLEENGQLVLEAESGTTSAGGSHTWDSQTVQTDYAGTAYLRALPDIGQQYDASATANSPGLNFTVQIDNPGSYTVWARGMAPDAAGDSLHVGVNDGTPTTATSLTGFVPNEWSWSRLTMSNTNATVELNSSGIYTLNVWMAEDGLRLDKLMLVTDTATIPTGQGSLESGTTTALPPLGSHTIVYDYDDLYRLTGATYSGDITATYSYVYDAVGNMEAYTETVGTETSSVNRTFDDANQLLVSTDTELGTTSFYYDGNGNLDQILPPGVSPGEAGEQLYSFDQRNLITQYRVGAGGSVYDTIAEYAYDGNGNRLQQIDSSGETAITTTYTNDNAGMSQVLVSDDGTTTTYNLFGLDLIQQDDGSETRTLLVDGLGSARVEMVGNTIGTATTYEPYGKLLAQSGSSGTVYGYTGEQHDAATSLVYLRARYYNPNLKVFHSHDPYPGTLSRPSTQHGYSYVSNNPVNRTDPSGLCEEVADEGCWGLYEEIVRRFPHARNKSYLYGLEYVSLDQLPYSRLVNVLHDLDAQVPSIKNIVAGGTEGFNAVIRYFEVYDGSASVRLEQLLRETDMGKGFINLQLPFGFPLSGAGLCDEYQDQHHYDRLWGGDSLQTSHFLTAVALTYNNLNPKSVPITTRLFHEVLTLGREPYKGQMETALRLIIGHELVSDTIYGDGRLQEGRAYWLQYQAATDADIDAFIAALEADLAGNTSSRDTYLRSILGFSDPSVNATSNRKGNSFEDLLLSLKGVEFGGMIRLGDISTSQEAASWLRNMAK